MNNKEIKMSDQKLTNLNMPNNKPVTQFFSVAEFAARHPWPSQAGLRNLIFHSKTNGFESCLIRVGKRVLIDEERFIAWMRDPSRANRPGSASMPTHGTRTDVRTALPS